MSTILGENGQRLGPKEIHAAMSLNLYDRARQAGMSLSQLLEQEDPSGQYKDGTNAFQRQFRVAGIITRSDVRGQYHASPVEAFGKNPQVRALFPEWCLRTVDEVRFRHQHVRAPFVSDDTALGSFQHPYADDTMPRLSDQTAPAIPLEETVARTRTITGTDTARSTYITRDATQARRKRVAEGASIPRAKIVTSSRLVPTYKYGIALEISYEAMRRLPIDDLAFYMRMEAIQSEIDKVAAVLDIMVNGDGNSGTSGTVSNLTTLDAAAAAGTLTLKGWIAWKSLFLNPYQITHVIGTSASILQLQLLNSGSANLPIAVRPEFGGLEPINGTLKDGVRYGISSDAPALKLVGYDRRFAIGRIFEAGSQIQEMERWILNQEQVLAMTEQEGYETIDANGIRLLDINA